MEQTANTGVEVEEEVITSEPTDAVDSSSTEEQGQAESDEDELDLASKSPEELIEFARAEHKAKKAAVAHLREQASKHRPDLESPDVETPTEGTAPVAETDDLDARIAKAVEQRLQQQTAEKPLSEHAKGSTAWLMKQSWATPFLPETPGSDPLYAELVEETRKICLEPKHKVSSPTDYLKNMKIAAAKVLGSGAPLMQEPAQESPTLAHQRSMSTSPSTSAGKVTKKQPTQAEIDFAIACGHDPKKLFKE